MMIPRGGIMQPHSLPRPPPYIRGPSPGIPTVSPMSSTQASPAPSYQGPSPVHMQQSPGMPSASPSSVNTPMSVGQEDREYLVPGDIMWLATGSQDFQQFGSSISIEQDVLAVGSPSYRISANGGSFIHADVS